MNPKPYELWLMREMLLNPRRRVIGYSHVQEPKRKVNPPGSADPERRAERRKAKSAAHRKKASRKASRR